MKFVLRTTSALTALIVVTSAHAADLGVRVYTKAPVAPAFSWTGFYLSGGAGYGMWTADQRHVQGAPDALAERNGGRGYFGTGGGGYDWQFNSRWVAGVFADAQFGDMSGSIDSISPGAIGTTRNNLNYATGARLGYLIAPNVLSYVNAGYSHAEFGSANLVNIVGQSTPYTTPKFSRDGWFVGGGLENSLNIFGIAAPGWFMKSEYRLAGYGSTDIPMSGGPVLVGNSVDFKSTVQTVSTSLVYRFNANGVPAAASEPLTTKAPGMPVSNWTGFYVGAGGGYGMSTADNIFQLDGAPAGASVRSGGNGAFGTVSGGYDVQFNRSWVAGVFADAQFGNIQGMITPPALSAVIGTTSNDLNYAAGLRVGYLVAPNVLSYVNGGYSRAEFKSANLAVSYSGVVAATTAKAHFDGWFLGGGVENSLNIFGVTAPNWFMKTEYRVAEYNRKNVDIFDVHGLSTPYAVAFKPYVQTISSSLVYRFN